MKITFWPVTLKTGCGGGPTLHARVYQKAQLTAGNLLVASLLSIC